MLRPHSHGKSRETSTIFFNIISIFDGHAFLYSGKAGRQAGTLMLVEEKVQNDATLIQPRACNRVALNL